MKVIRLQRGYSIRLTDSDFGVLETLVGEAEAGEIEIALIQYMEPHEKAAWRRRAGCFLSLDEDRRK